MALVFAAFLGLPAAYANGPEIGRDAGVIFPVKTDKIQLVSETVLARLPNAFADYNGRGLTLGTVDCTYVLRNLGAAAQEFEMAFLANRPTDYYRAPSFTVSVDGQPTQVVFAQVDKERWAQYEAYPPDTLPTWMVSIAPHGEARIEIAYAVSWSNSDMHRDFHYHAMPAALWAGEIETARIEFQILPPAEESGDQMTWHCSNRIVEPGGYFRTATGVVWEMRNWEPSTDFRLWVTCDADVGNER